MPFSEKQLAVLAFPYTDYDALICDGAVRSGKTSVMFVSYINWAMTNFNGCNFIVAGKTVKSAVRNVIKPFLLMTYSQERYSLKWSNAENILTVSDGKHQNTFYVFGGKDESSYELVQGLTAAGVFLDEVALCVRSFVEQCLARCSVDGSRFWFNCNPSSPEHWFRKEWILKTEEKNVLYLHFTMDDNPSLSEQIKARYRSQYAGVFKQRYIDGLWVIAEGLVYGDCKPELEGVEPMAGELCWVSLDYGITNPFAALMWVVRKGVAYCVDEYVFDSREANRRLTDEELYSDLDAWIEKATGKHREAVETIIIDPSATSFKETIQRHGVYPYRNARNDVNDGIQRVQTAMTAGALRINPKCKTLRKELGLYCWDEKASEHGIDRVVKENDHACDAMRYFIATIGVEALPCLFR